MIIIISLMTLPNCRVCTSNMKLLDDNGIKYDIMDLRESSNMEIARKHGIRSAGTHLYNKKTDEVIPVNKVIKDSFIA